MYAAGDVGQAVGRVRVGEGVPALGDRVQALVGVHPRAVDPVDRLGHERRVQAVLLGDRLERELEGDRVVGGLERVGVLEVDLVLAGRDLVVGGLDADPERLERVDHVLADLLGEVGREVEVAGLVVRQRRDPAVLAAAEQEELELRAGVDDVAELARPLDLAAEHVPRVAGERLAARREHVADDAGRAARRPSRAATGSRRTSPCPGIRYWSLSAIRVKPSIEEPSNQVPWRTEPSSWWIGIVTALTTPRMSVNWSWTKRMPPSRAASIRASASLAVLDRQCRPPARSRGRVVRAARNG